MEWGDLARHARTELLALAPGTGGHSARIRQACRRASVRGVAVRLIEEAGRTAPDPGGTVERRFLARLPHTLILLDRRAALLTARDGTGVPVTVRQPALVEALSVLFTSLWREARPDAAEPETRHDRDTAVLDMLACGVTDEAAAARLGVSIRTYRRWVADVMTRLGATSRFQAGLLASRDGWCPADLVPAPRRPAAQLPRRLPGPAGAARR